MADRSKEPPSAERGGSDATPNAAVTPPAVPPARRRLRLVAGAVIVVVVATVGIWYWVHADIEKTDNAQLDADVVPIRAQTGGIVDKVLFHDNQLVEAGQVLVEIQRKPHEIEVARAEANLAEAKASLQAAEAEVQRLELTNPGERSAADAAVLQMRAAVAVADGTIREAKARHADAKRELDRARELFASKAVTKVKLEQAQSALELADAVLRGAQSQRMQAIARQREMEANRDKTGALTPRLAEAQAKVAASRARVAAAESAREAALLDLGYTKVVAPVRGIASKRVVAAGQLLAAGAPIVTVVRVDQLWVTANFKETQLGRMKPGNTVEISIDAYGGTVLRGEVESISAATGARFSLLPPDNATGNFTKVVQRVPVRIRLLDVPADLTLRPGLSVEVAVDVSQYTPSPAAPRIGAPSSGR